MLGALLHAACTPPETPPPDRVVLVSIDTLRADHLGSYGARRSHTRHMDALAESGVRFEQAISPAPLTLPSHASLMTGLEPPGHGVRHNSLFRLPASIPTLAEGMRAAGYATAGFVGAVVLDRRYGLDRGFDVYDDHMVGRRSALVGFAERRADDVVDAVEAWLENAPGRFFLWVHFYDPHAKYDPPAGFASAFASRPYEGEIAFVDAQLGRLLAAIRARGGDEGLLVVLTSDHGESLGEHGEPTHSYSIYDATQRVPLLMSGPRVPAGRVVETPVRLIDVAPTLLRMAGARPLPGALGRDLRGAIDGDDDEVRTAYLETVATQLDMGWSPLLGLRAGGFKYIRAPRPELYDLRADPAEKRDLAALEPERVASLDALLEARLSASPEASPPPVALSEAEREQLRSLGYLAPQVVPPGEQLGRVGGADPKDRVAVLQQLSLAQSELARGKPEEALAALEGIGAPGGIGGPGDVGASGDIGEQGATVEGLRASAALAAGRYALAVTAARAGLRAQPGRADIWVILGIALDDQGRHPEAAEAFETAAHIDPTSARAQIGLGRWYEREGELAAAAASYQRAHEAGEGEAGWRLAALHIEAGRDDAASALLGSLSPATLNDPSAVLRLAGAEANRGLEEASLRRLALALARQPREPRLAVAMATVHLARGEPAQALIVVEGLEPTGSPDLETRLGLARARAQAELGDADAARRTLNESLARADGASDALVAEARRFRATLGP